MFTLTNTDSQFINSNSGVINIGIDLNGNATGVGLNSYVLKLDTSNSTATESQNHGTINIGDRVIGSNLIYSIINSPNYFTNYGTIHLNGNQDTSGNQASNAAYNTAMYRSGNTSGIVDFVNAGTINVNGYGNIALRALNRGKILSTGVINVNGNGGLNNYGAWVEGNGSIIEIANDVNLTGNNSIGIHAKDRGQITLSNNGQVTFADGENQIGYYIYGSGSKIVNTSTGSQDVSTKNSTLMRLDGGASFTGSPAATSTMAASGENAKVIVATGTGTSVNSGGMTVNVTGLNATGFLVEGGATGTIDSATMIKLAGDGAIAGIADGQGHDLSGAEVATTDGEKAATILTAGATLNSTLDDVIGYIARNLATINNSGDITFTGQNTTGILVEEGAKGINSGNIILGDNSVGLKASANTAATSLTSTGSLILNGNGATGIVADGPSVTVEMKTDGVSTPTIKMNGNNAVGVKASGGSSVILDSSVVTQFLSTATDQIAFWLSGKADNGTSSSISVANTTSAYDVSGERSTLFYVDGGATLSGNINANVSGKNASGIRVSDADSTATVASGSQITVSGQGATGVLVQNAGEATIAAGSTFTVSGTGATVGIVEGTDSTLTNSANVSSPTASNTSTAFIARDGGELNNTANIDLSLGSDHVAIDVINGKVVNSGSIVANGTAIRIQGASSVINNSGSVEAVNGNAAIELGLDASLDLSAITGTGTIIAKGSADGILLLAGAIALNVSNTTIDMSDATSTGIGIHNKAGISGIKLDNTNILVNDGIGIYTGATLDKTNSGTIDVASGIGILFQNTNGSATNNDFDLSNSNGLTINVNDTDGIAIKADLTGANRNFDSAVNVNLNTSDTIALDISGAETIYQRGDIITTNGTDFIKSGNASTIINTGKIDAQYTHSNIFVMNGAINKTFSNDGEITGKIDFIGGKNTIQLNDGSSTISQIELGSGNNNQLTASGTNYFEGSINAIGNSNTLTFADNSNASGVAITLAGGDNILTLTDNAQITTDLELITMGNGNNIISLSNNSKISGNGTRLGNGQNTITLNDSAIYGHTVYLGTGENSLTLSDSSQFTGILHLDAGKNTILLQDSSQFNTMQANNGGENHITVKDSATFNSLDGGQGGADDTLTFDNAAYQLNTSNKLTSFEQLNLLNGTVFTLNTALLMGDSNTEEDGRINIDGTSTLEIFTSGAQTIGHALLGTGTIDIQNSDSFDFVGNAGNLFAGTVKMDSLAFDLSGQNTTALTNATLELMGNNVTTVGTGTQNIGGLTINGGTLDFSNVSLPGDTKTNGFINASGNLDASGAGTVIVNSNAFDNSTAPTPNQNQGLLDQQNETLLQLAAASTVNGTAGSIDLIDTNSNVLSNGTIIAINQGATHAANATYDYRLTTTNQQGDKGLYVGYGLKQLELLTFDADQLVINTAHSTEKTLSAKITGMGDLGIAAGNGASALTISNLNNDYLGATNLQTGTLILGSNNALGQTYALNLANATTADINGKTQTIGELNTVSGSTLNLNNGNLTLSNGGLAAGNTLTNNGNLILNGGTFTVSGANNNFTATTTVNAVAEAIIQHVLALGSGNIVVDGNLTADNTSGSLANSLSGAGFVNSDNGSDIRLSGDNSQFAGIFNIDNASTLTVSENKHIGNAGNINNQNQFIVDNDKAMTLATTVLGSGDLIKSNSGTLTLAGSNDYSGKTLIQNGIVAISADDNLGNGSGTNLTVLDGGDLQITANMTSSRDVTLAQSGSVIVDSNVTATLNGWDDGANTANTFTKAGNGTLIWTGDNSANTADISVTAGTLQIENRDNLASANGSVNLGANGRLSILKETSAADNFNFTRQVSGTGGINVNLGDKAKNFTFDNTAAGGNFTGTLYMDNGRFELNTNASNVMSNATLQLNGNGNTLGSTRLDGTSSMGGLTINGGQVEVDYSTTDHRPLGHLTVNTLSATGGGSLAITTPANLPTPLPITGESLFDQDDGVHDQIVAASTVYGSGTQLQLLKLDGTPVMPDTIVGLIESGSNVGNAHYNYFGAVKDNGLYLGYGLIQLDAFSGQFITLDNSNATDNTLGAKLTGDGGFNINATGSVRIGNAASNYTGDTNLNTGTVVLITNNALGQTSALNMQSGTTADLNGVTQTIGSLNALANSVVNFNAGHLTITNGGQTDGRLTGAGQLTLAGGTLAISQNNHGFTGTTNINNSATALLTHVGGLGQGIINNEGTLRFDNASGAFLNSLAGTNGHALLMNNSQVVLQGNNQNYAGKFTTSTGTSLTAARAEHLGNAVVDNQGSLILDTNGRWSLANQISGNGTLTVKGGGIIEIDTDHVAASLTNVENGTLIIGSSAVTSRAASSPANLTSDVLIHEKGSLGGYGTVTGDVTNSGSIIMGHALTADAHGNFTIDGNYTGDDGLIVFGTKLANDSSDTDKLVITGNTSGSSSVKVINARGAGELTENGIQIINVGGNSDGTFRLSGRAVAGAYEYFLYQHGVTSGDDGHWYLRSELGSEKEILAPEVGGYLANMAAAGRLFNLRLEDREGRAENSSMWLRQVAARNKSRDNTDQLRTASNTFITQLGGEVWNTQATETDRFGLGVMAGYAKANSETRSKVSGNSTKSTIDGYSVGVYGTWYQNAATLNGTYVDSWLQYSWLDAEISGQQYEKYDLNGFSASLEAGHRIWLGENREGHAYLTPQAQVIWNGIKADSFYDNNGFSVKGSGHNNIQTRLGMKLSLDGVHSEDQGKDKLFTLYAEANWLYNSKQAGVIIDGAQMKQAGSRNVGEIKVGFEGQLNKNVNVWTNVAQQLGKKGYQDTAATVGVKYRF